MEKGQVGTKIKTKMRRGFLACGCWCLALGSFLLDAVWQLLAHERQHNFLTFSQNDALLWMDTSLGAFFVSEIQSSL